MAPTNCLVPRGLASVIFFLKKYQKVIHSPIVVMVEKLGLYSQALAPYQKTSLCKALVLRYSKPLCLDLSELIFSGFCLYPLCSPYSLMLTSVLGLSALRSLVCISLMLRGQHTHSRRCTPIVSRAGFVVNNNFAKNCRFGLRESFIE